STNRPPEAAYYSMILLEVTSPGGNVSVVLFFGTIGMLALTIGLIVFIIFHQRKVIRYQTRLQRMEQDQQKLLLNASIRLQEEERQRIAADLHDDAGPLLATARLYLNANSRFHDYRERLQAENELIIFRVIQELVNNILKHSNASFIHLTQNTSGNKFFIRLHHDGRGITQADFNKLNKSNVGLGLKNIQSRLKVLHGKIFFEKDMSQTYYKVTIELQKDEENKLQEQE